MYLTEISGADPRASVYVDPNAAAPAAVTAQPQPQPLPQQPQPQTLTQPQPQPQPNPRASVYPVDPRMSVAPGTVVAPGTIDPRMSMAPGTVLAPGGPQATQPQQLRPQGPTQLRPQGPTQQLRPSGPVQQTPFQPQQTGMEVKCEGFLMKKGQVRRNWKTRWFKMDSTALYHNIHANSKDYL